METDLLPCPFCGSDEQPTVFGLKPYEWWVECSGYDGLCCKLFLSTTKEEAIRKWNTRATAAAPLDALDLERVSNIRERVKRLERAERDPHIVDWSGAYYGDVYFLLGLMTEAAFNQRYRATTPTGHHLPNWLWCERCQAWIETEHQCGAQYVVKESHLEPTAPEPPSPAAEVVRYCQQDVPFAQKQGYVEAALQARDERAARIAETYYSCSGQYIAEKIRSKETPDGK